LGFGIYPGGVVVAKKRIIVTTGNEVAGRTVVKYLGVVRGIVLRWPGWSRGISASLAALTSGNLREFEEVCEEARAEAYARMLDHARDKDADAVIAMRYDATGFGEGVAEVLAYGTAVRLNPADEPDAEDEPPSVARPADEPG
jgi:uncharacterized protein YbjQ (UPF0145 family)